MDRKDSMKAVIRVLLQLLLLAIPAIALAQDPPVNLTSIDEDAAEAGQDPARFTVTRSNNGNIAGSINVYVAVEGEAVIGTDYATTNLNWSGSPPYYYITIPAGQLSATSVITPILDNNIEGPETAAFTLVASPGYTVGTETLAEVTIKDFVEGIFKDGFEDL
jgi:hypothetical protein